MTTFNHVTSILMSMEIQFIKHTHTLVCEHVTVFCERRQDLKYHLLLLVLRLFLEQTHQLLGDVGGGKLLFAGL